MSPLKYLLFISLFFFLNESVNAADSNDKISISFEISDKNNKKLISLSFSGDQRKKLSADAKNETDLLCESTGKFEKMWAHKKQFVSITLENICIQNNQTTKSKIGPILIAAQEYETYVKTIFLHKSQPDAILTIKELGF